jgi:hypothetical protein
VVLHIVVLYKCQAKTMLRLMAGVSDCSNYRVPQREDLGCQCILYNEVALQGCRTVGSLELRYNPLYIASDCAVAEVQISNMSKSSSWLNSATGKLWHSRHKRCGTVLY